ncbi:MFS transporter [Streptomyces sp. NPDC091267]|uniref:MFS transporter n=1 Tax=Streptomyces sp. NPDC091267 TaxID=3155195 RepID=UPI003439C79A
MAHRGRFWVSPVAAAIRAAWLLAPVIGTLVDRMPWRRSMVGGDLARCATLSLMGALVATGWAPVTVLVLLAFVSGVAEVFFDSAAQPVVPTLATDQQLERADARVISAQIIGTGFVGPPMGAALWAAWHPPPFLLDGATFLVSALLLTGLPNKAAPATADGDRGMRSLLRGAWAGLRFLARDRGSAPSPNGGRSAGRGTTGGLRGPRGLRRTAAPSTPLRVQPDAGRRSRRQPRRGEDGAPDRAADGVWVECEGVSVRLRARLPGRRGSPLVVAAGRRHVGPQQRRGGAVERVHGLPSAASRPPGMQGRVASGCRLAAWGGPCR